MSFRLSLTLYTHVYSLFSITFKFHVKLNFKGSNNPKVKGHKGNWDRRTD